MDFPFIGAGRGTYFEWAEVVVCFARAPSKAQAAAIGKRVPKPLAASIDWTGRVLSVGSEQGVGRTITAAYAKPAKAPTTLTTQSKFKIAPAAAYKAFDADIDAWLAAAHAIVPIAVAYRREDLEAGGSELSAWHHDSVAALPGVLRGLAGDADAAGLALRIATYATAVEPALIAGWTELEAAREAAEDAARDVESAAAAKARDKALAPKSKPGKTLDAAGVAKACDALARSLPAFAKRLRKAPGATLRPGASKAALAAVEKQLGVELPAGLRALLSAFDGGRVGDITFLGTAAGGARGEDELVAFTRATGHADDAGTIYAIAVAHTARTHTLKIFLRKPDGGMVLHDSAISHDYKKLDAALDAVVKAGAV